MKKLSTELAIIAAGPAGLAAAIAAAEKGVSVMVFEKMSIVGGTANMGMGPFGVESRIQKSSMIGLTKEEAFKIMMDYTHWQVDARLVRDYFWKSGDTIDWLEDMGVQFDSAQRMYPGGEATWHVVKPEGGGRPTARSASAMTKVMHERALELGVEFYFETPVKKILSDGHRVHGLVAEDKNGEDIEVSAKSVIVATGGYGTNHEMIKELCDYDWGVDLFSFVVPGIMGDGVKMAWEAGAAKGHTEMERILGCEIPGDGTYSFTAAFRQPRSLVVNLHGERIMDENELQNGAVAANAVMLQPNRSIYAIITDRTVRHFKRHGVDWPNGVFHSDPTEAFVEQVAQSKEQYPRTVFEADSIAELAEAIGIDPQALEATVGEYNDSCQKNYDDLLCKSRRYLMPIEGKKYYALRFTIGAYGSLGGIKINHKFHVLNNEDKWIQGFYGAGSDVCDIYAGTYQYKLAGNTMGFALNSGRLAGEYAAEFIDSI